MSRHALAALASALLASSLAGSLGCSSLGCTGTRALGILGDGAYAIRAEHPAPHAGAFEVTGDRGGVWIEPGAQHAPSEVTIFARTNANDAFAIDVRYPRGVAGCERGILVVGGEVRLSESWGGDADACSLDFEVDAPYAARAAAAFGVPLQERRPTGMWVTGVFSTTAPSYTAGQPVEIVLTLRSPLGSPIAQWERGGRNRGPRDNQFSFTVTRDGQPLPPIEGMDGGGRSQLRPLAPGGSDEVHTPLAPWADLSVPGRYEVDCTYETIVVPANVDPYGDGTAGQRWDRAFTGHVAFEVLPPAP